MAGMLDVKAHELIIRSIEQLFGLLEEGISDRNLSANPLVL